MGTQSSICSYCQNSQNLQQVTIQERIKTSAFLPKSCSTLSDENMQEQKELRLKIIQGAENPQDRIEINNIYLTYLQKKHNTKPPQLLKYIYNGDIAQISKILKKQPNFLNEICLGQPLLYHAIRCGYYDIVQLMLKKNCILSFPSQTLTPMHVACYYGHKKIINLLNQYGIPINIYDSFNKMPIDYAPTDDIRSWVFRISCYPSQQKQIKFINYQSILGISPEDKLNLHIIKAAFRQKMIISNKDRNKRIQLNMAYLAASERIITLKTPSILIAIAKDNKQLVLTIIKNNPILLNGPIFNLPAVYHAVKFGNYDIVQLLLKLGCNKQFQGQKHTPIHCAAYYGHLDIINLLMQNGFRIKTLDLKRRLPMELAANQQTKRLLLQYDDTKIWKLPVKLYQYDIKSSFFDIIYKYKIIAKKIILHHNYFKTYNNHRDAFHGTKYQNLLSIALHGLQKPGYKIADKQISIADGHIQKGKSGRYKKDWSDAIFVTPSIFYATHESFAKQFISQNSKWHAVIQLKILQNSYQQFEHTLDTYKHKQQQTPFLQWRIQSKQDQKQNKIAVVAIIFIKKIVLQNVHNYKQFTQIILNSKEEQQIIRSNQHKK